MREWNICNLNTHGKEEIVKCSDFQGLRSTQMGLCFGQQSTCIEVFSFHGPDYRGPPVNENLNTDYLNEAILSK